MKPGIRRIFGVLALIVLCVIWGHSMMPADVSAGESGRVLSVVSNLLSRLHIPGNLTEYMIRKTAHFLEYMLFAVLACGSILALDFRKQIWRYLAAVTWVPLIDETIQLFTQGRSGQIQDIWLDLAGILTGTFSYIFCVAVILHKQRENSNEMDKKV